MRRQSTQSQLTLNLKRKTTEPLLPPLSKELRETLADLLLAALNLQIQRGDKETVDDA